MKKNKKTIIIAVLAIVLIGSVLYINSKKKRTAGSMGTEDKTDNSKKVFTKGTNVNLRSSPSTNSTIITNIPDDNTLLGVPIDAKPDADNIINQATNQPFQWIKIRPDSSTGLIDVFYVREDLLTI